MSPRATRKIGLMSPRAGEEAERRKSGPCSSSGFRRPAGTGGRGTGQAPCSSTDTPGARRRCGRAAAAGRRACTWVRCKSIGTAGIPPMRIVSWDRRLRTGDSRIPCRSRKYQFPYSASRTWAPGTQARKPRHTLGCRTAMNIAECKPKTMTVLARISRPPQGAHLAAEEPQAAAGSC